MLFLRYVDVYGKSKHQKENNELRFRKHKRLSEGRKTKALPPNVDNKFEATERYNRDRSWCPAMLDWRLWHLFDGSSQRRRHRRRLGCSWWKVRFRCPKRIHNRPYSLILTVLGDSSVVGTYRRRPWFSPLGGRRSFSCSFLSLHFPAKTEPLVHRVDSFFWLTTKQNHSLIDLNRSICPWMMNTEKAQLGSWKMEKVALKNKEHEIWCKYK